MGQVGEILAKLQSDILRLQHFNTTCSAGSAIELGPLKHSFPGKVFPLGVTHEFVADHAEGATSSGAFILTLLHSLLKDNGIALWVSAARMLFPPALQTLGVNADRFIFVDVKKDKDVLWVIDEALKCGALTAVIGEVRDISFNESRKLQLAVEQSKVTGFILRHTKKITPTASVSRWKITSLPSEVIDDLPGIGFPKWKVELLRIRNGKPGVWDIQWKDNRFIPAESSPVIVDFERQKAG